MAQFSVSNYNIERHLANGLIVNQVTSFVLEIRTACLVLLGEAVVAYLTELRVVQQYPDLQAKNVVV